LEDLQKEIGVGAKIRAVLGPLLPSLFVPKNVPSDTGVILFTSGTEGNPKGVVLTHSNNSLRIAVCGAERVREETRKTAEQRFDMEVLEGYGVTECAPVLAANQPGDIQSGTIGKMLPGIEARLEPVEGLEGGGQLWVRGPNIMKGYISPDNPGQIIPLPRLCLIQNAGNRLY